MTVPTKKKLLLSAITQFTGNGTNFLVLVLSSIILSKPEFAEYGIIGFLLSIALSVVNSVFITQLTVEIIKEEDEKKEEIASAIFSLLILFLPVVIVTIKLLSDLLNLSVARGFDVGVYVALAGVRLFLTRLSFSTSRESISARSNLIYCVITFAYLFYLENSESKIGVSSIINAMTIAAGTSSIYAAYKFGYLRPKIDIDTLKKTAKKITDKGKWSLATVLILTISSQSYVVIVPNLTDVTTLAGFTLARQFVSTFGLIYPVISELGFPHVARILARNNKSALTTAFKYSILAAILASIYFFILDIFFEKIFNILDYKKYDYDAVRLNFRMLFVITILQIFRDGPSFALQGLWKFKQLFFANLAAACLGLSLSLCLGYNYEISGVLYGIIVSELVLLGSMVYMLRTN